ncbi:ABC transporter permease [Micrococcus luteus]|uniref:ABC transporter permease n=1 Tax=Micrococcus luteus TaxID=1270 RepID=UPI0033E817CB
MAGDGNRVFTAAVRLQFRLLLRNPTEIATLILLPLQALGIYAVVSLAGDGDLVGIAIIAPAIMATWQNALYLIGDVVHKDRDAGRLEYLTAGAHSYFQYLLGRACAITAYSIALFVLSLAVGGIMLNIRVSNSVIPQLLLVAVLTCVAVGLTGLLLSVFFIFAKSPHTYQNALGYPIFIVGGVLVPPDLYPAPIQFVSHWIFLSWSAEAMRSLVRGAVPESLWTTIAMLTGSCIVIACIASWAIGRAVERLREKGEFNLA